MKFYIDYGTGEPQCVEGNDPGEAMKIAEKGATLTHEPIFIRTDKGRAVAIRNWYENLDGITRQSAPLKIGDGYYGDWRMNTYTAADRD
ncbi:MAG: hypothetical protein JXK94_02410 [Deltaproteobacteria bacterium]|nr:hypothetical protein [Deltaproteobacteria bacterium]